MPTAIRCAGCGARFNVSEALLGKRVRCNSCARVILVGERDDEPDAAAGRRPPRRRRRREYDEDDVPMRRRRSRHNQPVLIALVIGGVAAGALLLGLVVGGMWWLLHRAGSVDAPTAPAQPTSLAVNPTPPMQGNPSPPNVPAPAPAMPQPPANRDDGGQTVQLSNARVSGFGARIQIEVDFRFNSGVAGPDVYLIVKPTRHLGLHQTLYEIHLRHAAGKAQGTVVATGMTFGIENGPFDVWMEEGGPSGFMRGLGGPERRTISNVLRVQTKELSLPGPMHPPNLPGMPHIPRPGFPFGPRR